MFVFDAENVNWKYLEDVPKRRRRYKERMDGDQILIVYLKRGSINKSDVRRIAKGECWKSLTDHALGYDLETETGGWK